MSENTEVLKGDVFTGAFIGLMGGMLNTGTAIESGDSMIAYAAGAGAIAAYIMHPSVEMIHRRPLRAAFIGAITASIACASMINLKDQPTPGTFYTSNECC